ncbi:MAG: 1-(5-phosphoribosyl)-5-[(5-phosphoribosylamino)methylideneamino]imidazole-4-carboxamide isomerase [Bdellovibrionales bacterium]|jgi:phosphoribosylformimino-5-aminoimidazole carboxamide ribotide isomerase|nr:1-(5-phosphoribosyl)-5-[(5-phosphoribosylamino)methylideneamino]imidazole-4-carboxamide isomerase [Bdellovibrionales bacterium]
MKIWPAIDLLEGKCVRLIQGDYSQCKIYDSDPVVVAKKFEAEGAKQIHLVDLSRAKNPMDSQINLIEQICKQTELLVQVGGGIRSLRDAEDLMAAGASRLVIGSLAVTNPSLTEEILSLFGDSVLALDVQVSRGDYFVATHAWTVVSEMTPESIVAGYPKVKSILCTDISRDGKLNGPSLALYSRLRKSLGEVEIIASGGVNSLDDLRELQMTGCEGAIIGKAFYEGRFSLKEALACLQDE